MTGRPENLEETEQIEREKRTPIISSSFISSILSSSSGVRRRILAVTPEAISNWVKTGGTYPSGYRVVRVDGVPADMSIIGTQWDPTTNSIIFVVESDEFDLVRVGEAMPYLVPVYHYEYAGQKRKIKPCFSCFDYVHHEHRWKWTAWICGRLQWVFTWGPSRH